MDQTPKPSGLAAAVCAVMTEVTNVPKTGMNSFHKYQYASDADLLRELQPSMAKNGLMMYPRAVEKTLTAHGKSRQGNDQWRTDVVVTYALVHTSGEQIDVIAHGCGLDSEDKGVYKAMTGAIKYALRQLFLVPTGDDPEHDAPPQGRPAQQQPTRPQQQAPAQRPPAQQQPQQSAKAPAQQPAQRQPAKLAEVQKPAQKPAEPAKLSDAQVKAREMARVMLERNPEIRKFIPGSLDDAHAARLIKELMRTGIRLSEDNAAAKLCERLDFELKEAEAEVQAEIERSGDPFEARV